MPLGINTGNDEEARLAVLLEAEETSREELTLEMECREFDPKPARGERIEAES